MLACLAALCLANVSKDRPCTPTLYLSIFFLADAVFCSSNMKTMYMFSDGYIV